MQAPGSPGAGNQVSGNGRILLVETGTVSVWLIQADNGQLYAPANGLHSSFKQPNLRVAFLGSLTGGSSGGAAFIDLVSLSALTAVTSTTR